MSNRLFFNSSYGKMYSYTIDDQVRIEKAIILISAKFSDCPNLIKPTLLHSIRVGSCLYFHGYKTDIVIAGYLHDILEDTDVTEQDIIKNFGPEIAKIVKSNTKETEINEKNTQNEELIKKCLETSEEASIVKAADILDNYAYYLSLRDQTGIEYCLINAFYFKKHFKTAYNDKIFTKLFQILPTDLFKTDSLTTFY